MISPKLDEKGLEFRSGEKRGAIVAVHESARGGEGREWRKKVQLDKIEVKGAREFFERA